MPANRVGQFVNQCHHCGYRRSRPAPDRCWSTPMARSSARSGLSRWDGHLPQRRRRRALPPSVRSGRSDVPVELDDLIGDLLAKQPDHRPAGAAMVRSRLASVGEPSAAPTTTAATTTARWPTGRAAAVAPTQQFSTVDGPDVAGPTSEGPGGHRTGLLAGAAVTVVAAAVVVAALVVDGSAGRRADPPATPGNISMSTAPPERSHQTNGRSIGSFRPRLRQPHPFCIRYRRQTSLGPSSQTVNTSGSATKESASCRRRRTYHGRLERASFPKASRAGSGTRASPDTTLASNRGRVAM